MGSTLTIINSTPRDIWVEWWTPGYVFKVCGYTIRANSTGDMSKEAVWYDILITDHGKQFKATYYGGANSTWQFDGEKIYFVIGKSDPEAKAISFAEGQVHVPLDNPHIRKIIDFVKALDHKPSNPIKPEGESA